MYLRDSAWVRRDAMVMFGLCICVCVSADAVRIRAALLPPKIVDGEGAVAKGSKIGSVSEGMLLLRQADRYR